MKRRGKTPQSDSKLKVQLVPNVVKTLINPRASSMSVSPQSVSSGHTVMAVQEALPAVGQTLSA